MSAPSAPTTTAPTTHRRRLPAAAPAWVDELLTGPDRSARVLHRGADAVYLDVGAAPTSGTMGAMGAMGATGGMGGIGVLGVVSGSASAVPCALRTSAPALPADLLRDGWATVGAGRALLGDTEVVRTRTVAADVPLLGQDRLGQDRLGQDRLGQDTLDRAAAKLEAATGERLAAVVAELPAEALRQLAGGRVEAVPALLGRGGGLTPVGDDVLCGWLAVAVAAGALPGRPPVERLADSVSRLAPRATVPLSHALLECARRGQVLPQFRQLLLDLADPSTPAVGESVAAVLRVGHTSGAGLLLGARLAFAHLVPARLERSPR